MPEKTQKKLNFNIIKNKDVLWSLQTPDGKTFGDVSYDAYKAVQKGQIDKYKPKNNSEKKIINEYRNHPGIPLTLSNGYTLGNVSYDAFQYFSNNNTFEKFNPTNKADKKAVERYDNFLNNQAVEIPISDSKTLGMRYGTMKAIDDYAKNCKGKPEQKAKDIDSFVNSLGLDSGEISNAQAYANLKKLSFYQTKAGKNSAEKEITQPIAKFFTGVWNSIQGTRRFVFDKNFGGLLGGNSGYDDARNFMDKYFAENPDELGRILFEKGDTSKLFAAASNEKASVTNGLKYTGAIDDYFSDLDINNWLKRYDSTNKVTRWISDVGFGSAGEMLGAYASASFFGGPQIATGASNVGTALTAATSGTKVGKAVSTVANLSPKIKTIENAGKVATVANVGINAINKVSVGKALKFLNPLENPTTVVMGINAGQDKYTQLKRMGYDSDTAMSNALFTSYVNSVTEKMGYDGNPSKLLSIGKKNIAVDATTSRLKNATKIAKNYLSTSASEGVEEIYASVFERMGDVVTRVGYVDENGQIQQRKFFGDNGVIDINNIGESFLGGFVGGMVMGGTGLIGNIANYDINTIKEHSEEIKQEVRKTNDVIKTVAEEAGIENVVFPKEPDWEKATVEEVADYTEKVVETYQEILSDEKVIQHDEEIISNAVKELDNSEAVDETTDTRNTFTGELDEIASTEMPSVSVGDAFIDTKTNNALKIVGRDDTTTTIEVTKPNGEKLITTQTNKIADTFVVDDRYTQINTPVNDSVDNTVDISAQNTEDVLQNQSKSDTIEEKNTNTVADAGKGRTVAYTNDNKPIELLYKVVSADDLIVSNDLDGKINPNYPQELQPRDRSRTSSLNQIRQIANNLNPARLAESTNVSEGSPIVGADNVVESGNGRTLSVKLAYQMGIADNYRNYIISNAKNFGIDVSNLPKNPVLVRERLTDVDRKEFTRKANESSIGSLSATEQARVDAENLTEDILNLLVPNDTGEINTSDNKDFISAVLAKVFNNEDLNNVIGANNMLSARGLERITNAIFYKAYGDASLSARLSESLDNDMKNATKVLLNIAPKIVSIKNGISSGNLYDFDFSEDIVNAVRLFEKCRSEKNTIEQYSLQTSLFDKESSLTMAMSYVFETKNRGAKQATDFYNLLLDTVIELGNPNQMALEIFETFQTKEEILDATFDKFNTGVEPKNTITTPESIYKPASEEGRENDGRGKNEVSRNESHENETIGNADRVQQDNRPSEETGIVADDEQLRQKNESVEGKSEVAEVDKTQVYESNNGYVINDNAKDKVVSIKFNEKPSSAVRTALKNNAFVWNKTKGEWTRSGQWYSKNSVNDVMASLDEAYGTTPTQQAEDVTEKPSVEMTNEKSGMKEIDTDALFGAVRSAKDGDEIKLSDYEKQDFSDKGEVQDTRNNNVTETSSEGVLNNESANDTIEEKESVNEEGVKNDESKSEVLARESGTDDRGLRSESSESNEQERTENDDRQFGNDSGEVLPQSVRTDGNKSDGRNDSERIHRGNDAEISDTETTGNDAEIADIEPETIETPDKAIDKKRPSNKENFVITDEIAKEFDNTLPSASDNIAAIELLLTLENEGRPATTEEKKILAKYKGWGGIDIRRIPWELSRKLYDLYDSEQLRDMQSSQNNAFFTPTGVIDAMYNGLKRMGFKGGNVLESSMGVGNFFGRMPVSMVAKSALTGVELESYTARIAQYLYPGATVINKPFQDVAIRNGSYDLVIGNVPFGTNKISYNKKKYSLHNYFIISSLDKVRDGGIVAVITSSGTLDSYGVDARKAIMNRADVVACYKLPERVFSRNANTDTTTDLLILKKRASDSKPSGDSILNVTTTDDGLRLNEYFVKHPENILGTLTKGTNAWGEITTVLDDGDFYNKLNEAMKKLPKDLISGKVELKPIETIVSTSSKPRFFEKNGKIYVDDGAGTATVITNASREKTIRDYMAVRDAYKDLLAAYDNDMSETDIKPLRDSLIKAYDDFSKKHDAITGDGKKKISNKKSKDNTFLEADADYYLVSGLERYDTKEKKFIKSALFEKDTLRKKKITSVDVASDALAVSLNESGKIDFARMSELTGKTEKQLVEELKGEIILTPEGDYVLTDIYLSGNIYEKIEKVKGKPEFKEQQEMLERVLPTPKDASAIMVKLGANYIDAKYIQDFSREVFNTRIEVSKNSSGTWAIEGVRQRRYGDILNVKYGCNAFNAIQLLEKVLNDSEITAKQTIKVDGKSVSVYDEKMTEIARQKAEDIKEAFENWIFRDSERRADVVDKYNRTYNNYRPLNYERIADKLSFDSMDETLKSKLYPHQKNGIARFLFGGNILFAHGVGTGKTFEMIASVMEAKRMGIVNKTAMVVPNNKVVDFKRDIAQAYPNAKVLVIDTANKKRQTMLGLVNSNDWDIVLIARTTFTKIPVGAEIQSNFINQQLEELDRQILEAEQDSSISKRKLKGLYTQRDNLEQKLKDLDSETKRDENSVDFEKLGFDCICVDEAHNYKSITTLTKLDIKGLASGSNAQQANDMLMKLDYMRSIDGRIIFGTGTPITNTVSEIYNMMRMVRPDILEDAGIHSLDEWVNTFAKIETHTEIGVDNKIKNKSTQTIRSFVNCTEMVGMFRQFADVVFTQDVVKNLPKAVPVIIELDGTEELRQIESEISNIISTASGKDALAAYTKAMAMANAASIDLKMLSGAESDVNIFKDYSLEELEYENSKINTMCNYVYDEYKASNDIKGTQIIFCDGGAGSGSIYSFNVHKDIVSKLVERGIPENEIVIVKNQKDAELEELFEKVNSGEVRVLIGTSRKMAEGLNVQKRVVAIHHPTVTFKPSDLEQGDARGVRAGNINKEVRIYRYLQGNTFDSYKWQAIDRKGEMINRALRGEAVDELEDIGADDDSDAGVDAATAMAITSGNPLVKEKIDIDKEVKRLKNLKQNYMNEHYRYEDIIAKNPGYIRQRTDFAQKLEKDIALRDKIGDKAVISINGKNFAKASDANKALIEAVKKAPKNGKFTKLGEYNGFDIMFKGDTGGMGYTMLLKGANEYAVEYTGNGNNIARISGVLNRLTAEQEKNSNILTRLESDLEFAKKEINAKFEQEEALTEALEKQKDITYRYEHFGEKKTNEQSETEDSETAQYFIESEDFNDEQTGNLLSDGSSERAYSKSSGKQAKKLDGRSSRYRESRTTASERRQYCQTLKTSGNTQEQIVNGHKCEVIPKEHYTDRMVKIAESNTKNGFDETYFIVGGAVLPFTKDSNGKPKTANGVFIKTKDGKQIAIVQYDNYNYMPEQINDHENIHNDFQNPRVQKIANIIKNSLSVTQRKGILERLSKDYNGIVEGNEEKIFEEFIANVLTGMDWQYSNAFEELSRAYWKNDDAFISNFKVSEYDEDIDSGGINETVLNDIGFSDEYQINSNDIHIPYNEEKQLNEYIISKNHGAKKLKSVDCKEIGNNFYVWKNNSKTGYEILKSIRIAGNEDFINIVKEMIRNGDVVGSSKSVTEMVYEHKNGRRRHNSSDGRLEEAGTHGRNAGLSSGKSGRNGGRYSVEDGRNKREDTISYFIDSVDDDIQELTQERKKEIFEQFERDRVGVDKPSQKQLWGERAEWIAHNMTRVFPEIPERGEKGVFFAEFRKMMIQWKALPQTAMFMTQDKLNQMTKDLTPEEFKTFSELVYFLDLQEEAQLQKERGYTEILLPNEITPHEVNQIVDILNTEATANVQKALDNRKQIWNDLKESYITLNQYVGFDTDGKFNRKNYYHHQVIEYMNQGGKGVAKGKDIEVKAGRGWLKERQGSTKAINTDFLAVEYKAMLQMQYDIYVANMLGKIKDKYDIKPKLEKQAFDHNKKLLNEKIMEEAKDEDGNVLIDQKGKPDSEIYRQQQWYNQRIMYGFSGLFELAEQGQLPVLNGQYGNIIKALKNQRLNVPGLYNYVGELASIELPETATDEEHQAQISARTVMKYTSQKKAWVKEVLGKDYQTWETLAKSMSDTHSIHQPRRGNYFYTKEVINEDAFNKAFNDMIVGLVAGENGVDTTTETKKLFEQYSETILQMGAAFEQWVIPNEVETTMNKVANPAQINVVNQLSRTLLSSWKGLATSTNIFKTVKFGVRNMIGDLDSVIAGNPQIIAYSPQAVKEITKAMKNKEYSQDFMEWVERGGYTAMIFANEMDTKMQDALFSHLKDKKGIKIYDIPLKMQEGYLNGVEAAHNFREAILRYSAYLYYKNDIIKNGGKVKSNVASNRYIIQGLESVEDKAYQLSKDLLGAYDEVAAMGQALRRHAIPFYSFTETNLKRYYRMFENIIMSDDKIPKKAGKLLLKALQVNLLQLLWVAWNRLVMKDEDDKLPTTARLVPHITLGRIGDDVYAFRQLGSFSELLEWVGLEDYKWTEEDLLAPVDKMVGMISPFYKLPVELTTGLNFYPSITQPRAIRDKWEHFFSTLGYEDVYKIVSGKPNKGFGDVVKGSFVYSYDYKESAYYEILDIKRKYQGSEDGSIYKPTAKSNALYYMKTAIRYKDAKTALKYLDEYFKHGGTGKGISQSIAMLNPMYGYTSASTYEAGVAFINSLSDEEKEKLKIAYDYYEKELMLPEEVAKYLRKKDITNEEAKNVLRKYIKEKCK